MTDFLRTIAAAVVRLWNTRDHLRPCNLRAGHLPYILAMPMGLGIGNMMSSLFRVNAPLLGMDPKVTLYCAYLLGACLFVLVPVRRFLQFSRGASALAAASVAAWLVLPWGPAQSAAATVGWLGLGGCVFCGTYAYMLVLNNTERFFGAVLIVINYGVCLLLDALGAAQGQLWKALPVLFLSACVFCLARFKPEDLAESFERPTRRLDKTMYPAFALFFVFFLMDAFISFLYVRGGQASILSFGAGAALGGLLSVVIQLVLSRSIWHVWNLYFILLAVSFALMQTDPGSAVYLAGAFLCGLCTIGYAASFYTFGGVMKKYGSYTVFKKYMCGACLPPLMIAFVITGFLNARRPEAIPLISLIAAVAFLVLYLLFSPLFQKYLFTAGWFDDYQRPDMTAIAAKVALSDHGLTRREKEVCALLLAGRSRKQIGVELCISHATVGFHCTSLYKKLKINSLPELFALFGYAQAPFENELQAVRK